MTGSHEPTHEFRTWLESEIVRTVRHDAPVSLVRRTARRSRTRTAVVVAVALALGAAAGAAPAQVQDAQQRAQLMEAAQAEEQLALIRLELARAAYADARARFALGATDRASLAVAEGEVRAMELNLARIRLDQEEIRAAAGPPRDEISAPLVGQRDFVTERLRLDLAAVQQQLTAVEREVAEAERRRRLGATPRGAMLDVQMELARTQGELQRLGARLALRQEFLEQDLSVGGVERRLMRQMLMVEANLARRLHTLAEERLTNLRELQAIGQVERLEVMRAEVEVMERAFELQRIARRLEMLDAAGGAQPDSGG